MIDIHPGCGFDDIALLTTRKGVIRQRIREFHTTGYSYPRIAKFPQYSPIPCSTIYSIAKGGNIPEKWWPKLGYYPKKRPPRIAIRLDDAESAAKTILTHMDAEVRRELVRLLEDK